MTFIAVSTLCSNQSHFVLNRQTAKPDTQRAADDTFKYKCEKRPHDFATDTKEPQML